MLTPLLTCDDSRPHKGMLLLTCPTDHPLPRMSSWVPAVWYCYSLPQRYGVCWGSGLDLRGLDPIWVGHHHHHHHHLGE